MHSNPVDRNPSLRQQLTAQRELAEHAETFAFYKLRGYLESQTTLTMDLQQRRGRCPDQRLAQTERL
jgi:hypothetical protein